MASTRWAVLSVVVLCGCVRHKYNIELTPQGSDLERRLTAELSGTDEEIVAESKRLARAFNSPPPEQAARHTYRGNFATQMPQDVGGYGSFVTWKTSLGSVAGYIERFRGTNDPAGELKRRQLAADRLTELLISWLERELKNDSQWPTLRRFLEEEFRHDLYNVSVFAWTIDLHNGSGEIPEPMLRAVHFLVERGYFQYDEIPTIIRAFQDLEQDRAERVLVKLRQFILKRSNAELPPPKLDFLASIETLKGSLRMVLGATPEFAELQRQWKERQTGDPSADGPDSLQVAGDLMVRLVLPAGGLNLGGDRLSLKLNTDRPAIHTNGQWSAEAGGIRWETKALPAGGMSPALAYAVWDEPNVAVQKKYFGRTVLRGESLAEYCLWYYGLTDEERTEWESFLENRRPGDGLEMELREFRLSGSAHRLPGTVIDAIVSGLAPPS